MHFELVGEGFSFLSANVCEVSSELYLIYIHMYLKSYDRKKNGSFLLLESILFSVFFFFFFFFLKKQNKKGMYYMIISLFYFS